ncbi:MAG: Gfo/Idh/MocA family oxidoreductase [Phycisphaerae bacterium]|nr:Gfo/Idh/MocA family oxidoreductase [Phycisphaerae bacterium]
MLSRRGFLKAAASTGPLIMSAKAFGQKKPSANEIVNVGMIGLGGRCKSMVKPCSKLPQMRVVAVCDCFKPRVDEFMKLQPEGWKWTGYTDFRKMIETEKLDGVMVETTTHARAWITCLAMEMGMDAYIEKPMCLTIEEGRHMVKIARKHKRVTQVGTQQRSITLNNWASDLVKNGALGKVTLVLAPNFIGPNRWEDKPGQEMPAGGDDKWWDIWTNQAVFRPYHSDLHRGWDRWWDYDGGGMCFGITGWGAHSYDQVQRGLGTDETGPVEIVLEEPVRVEKTGKFDDRKPSEDETGQDYYHMVKGLSGSRAKVRMGYANGTQLLLHLDADRGPGLGCIFVGEKGRIEINRDRISAEPKELIERPDNPGHLNVPMSQPHVQDWVECIKTRKTCTADIEYGQRSSTICYLANIVREVGKVGESLKWDPVAEKFTNCNEANALLTRARRKGYELPEVKG